MRNEGLGAVPREERPTPEQLAKYQRRYPDDPDLSRYGLQLGWWLSDWRREQEEKRGSDKDRVPLYGDEVNEEDIRNSRSGYDEGTFNIDDIVRKVESSPMH